MAVPAEFAGQWIGNLNGTLVGNLYVEFERADELVRSRFDANVNGSLFSLRGDVVDDNGILRCLLFIPAATQPQDSGSGGQGEQTQSSTEAAPDTGTASPVPAMELIFDQTTAVRLAGRWNMTNGNRGVFQLAPANTASETANLPSVIPPQIVSRQEDIPRLRLSRADLEDIVAAMKRAIPASGDVAITMNLDGNDVVQFSEDFFGRHDLPTEVNSIRLALNDQSPGIKNSIQITLSDALSNILVSSADGVWVDGVFQGLKKSIRRRVSKLSWWYQKHGLNINGLIFMIAIGLSPDLQRTPRFVFLTAVIILLLATKKLHNSSIRVRIYPRSDTQRPGNFSVGEVVTAIVGGVGAMAAIGLFNFLASGGLIKIGDLLSTFLKAS